MQVDPSTLESSGAPLRNLVKDLDFVGSAVAGTGIDAPVVTAVQKQFATAIEQGKSEADMAVLFNMLSPSSK
jgi:3-hydroxyisobutyrate dehydrogenase-like beta-hydroxyacid dehydrogenase